MPAVIAREPVGLTVNEEQHHYFANGVRVLSVTDALRLAGITDQIWGSDYDLWMGSARHKAIELWIKGTLNIASVHPDILPSVEAYLDFERATGFKPTHSEFKVWNPVFRVAGRLDILGEFPDGEEGIGDLKSGSVAKATALQLALYDTLLGASRTRKRFGLSVPKTGKPKVVEFNERDDYATAISVMNVAHWRIKHQGAKY